MVSSLTFTTLRANSTDNYWMIFFFRKQALTFHANFILRRQLIYMNYQTLFSWTNQKKKNVKVSAVFFFFFLTLQLADVFISVNI